MERLEIQHIASTLGQSEFTIRTLANRFVWFLPATRVGEDLLFRQDALEIFRLIIDQLEAGIRTEHIELMLSKRFPIAEMSIMSVAGKTTIDALPDTNVATPRVPQGTPPVVDSGTENHTVPGQQQTTGVQPNEGNDEPAQPSQNEDAPGRQERPDALDDLQRRLQALEQRLQAAEEPTASGPDAQGTQPAQIDHERHESVSSESNGASRADRSFNDLVARPSPWLRNSSE